MKYGKKQIIFSSACLVAAIALAIFTVYAWFTTNEKVRSDGINASIVSGDVLSFDVTYYNLTYHAPSKDENKELYYKVEDKVDRYKFDKDDDEEEESEAPIMPDYRPDFGLYNETTAVLMDIQITFAKTGNFYLKLNTTSNEVYNSSSFKKYIEDNNLSNVVYFQEVLVDDNNSNDFPLTTSSDDFKLSKGSQFTLKAPEYSFLTKDNDIYNYFDGLEDSKKKDPSIEFRGDTAKNYIVPTATGKETVYHFYYIMDYIPDQITSLYSLLLHFFSDETELTLSTPIIFRYDMLFEIGKNN
ncbi:MAG: hypothetical protein J1F36_02155 [Clostridiales bacterium]|nr:hypothetical protein [Clostridiales bacterium]